ncbi:MAG: hypothetical protein ACRESE_06980, partial [Gammaproteobacteria bacterium]
MNVPASRKLLSSEIPGTDYGIFLLAIPLVAIVALLIVALAFHSLPGFIWLLATTTVISACFVVSEIFQSHTAWESGSPVKLMLGWWGFVALLWPVG